jgi:hypothetical protein
VKPQTLLARSSKAVADASAADSSWGELLASNQFHVVDEYNKVLAEIRQQSGLEDFLLLTFSAERLQSISSEGPVVMFVQSSVSHTLIISQTGVLAEALPRLTRQCCEKRYRDFATCLEVRISNPGKAREMIEGFLHWL